MPLGLMEAIGAKKVYFCTKRPQSLDSPIIVSPLCSIESKKGSVFVVPCRQRWCCAMPTYKYVTN